MTVNKIFLGLGFLSFIAPSVLIAEPTPAPASRAPAMSAEEKAMYDRIMQLPPEKRAQAIREYRSTRAAQEPPAPARSNEMNSSGANPRAVSDEQAMYQQIMQLPPDRREKTLREYKARKEQRQISENPQGRTEVKPAMTAEDKAMYQKIMAMPPQQREQAIRAYRTRQYKQNERSTMTPEDKAAYEKMMQLPPAERVQATQAYKGSKR